MNDGKDSGKGVITQLFESSNGVLRGGSATSGGVDAGAAGVSTSPSSDGSTHGSVSYNQTGETSGRIGGECGYDDISR